MLGQALSSLWSGSGCEDGDDAEAQPTVRMGNVTETETCVFSVLTFWSCLVLQNNPASSD